MNLRHLLMPRRLLALLLLLAGATLARADPSPDCPPPARGPTVEEREAGWRNARDRGFLWKLTKDGRSSYLYGTVHIGKLDWIFAGPTVRNALSASDVLALELDLSDPDVMRRVQAGMAPRADRSLTPRLTARLHRQLAAACLPFEVTRTLSPEMVGVMLTLMAARREGLDAAYGIDFALAALSQQLGKPIKSLESPDLQISLFTSRSNQELRENMDKLLGSLETGKAGPMLTLMARMWEKGSEDELARYAEWCDCLGTARERAAVKVMLDDRNPGLASAIAALHAEGKTVFAAIGSLHMIGPRGVPAMLRASGHEVERVSFLRPPE